MASKRSFSEKDFTCPVCSDIFKEPVLLSCGHSVCRVCVRQYWKERRYGGCPRCGKQSFKSPPENLALRNLSQTFLEVRGDPETLCDIHGEKLKLYCVDEAQPVCVVCRESRTHHGHTFRPVEEVAVEMKDDLRKTKLKKLEDAQKECQQKIDYIKQQTEHVMKQVKEDFKKLHQFLLDETQVTETALQTEAQEKTQRFKKRIEKINQEKEILSKTSTDPGKELLSEDIKFVKNFKQTLEEAQCAQTDRKVAGELISVAKYLGNLQFKVWNKTLKNFKYTPVILDPNTAHTQLILSENLTSVRHSDDEDNVNSPQVPDIPEQFKRCLCVLGSVGFSSGLHSWDVKVGKNTVWMVGVTTESVDRKEHNVFPSGTWAIGYEKEQLCARSPSEPYTPLSVAAKPQVVRVHLDMNAGEVQFSEPSGTVIHTFKHRFTEKVFPFFHTLCSLSPLKILPLQPKKK